MIGGGLLAAIVLVAVFAPLLARHDPYLQDLTHRLIPPVWYAKGGWEHPLGTDNLGARLRSICPHADPARTARASRF